MPSLASRQVLLGGADSPELSGALPSLHGVHVRLEVVLEVQDDRRQNREADRVADTAYVHERVVAGVAAMYDDTGEVGEGHMA